MKLTKRLIETIVFEKCLKAATTIGFFLYSLPRASNTVDDCTGASVVTWEVLRAALRPHGYNSDTFAVFNQATVRLCGCALR